MKQKGLGRGLDAIFGNDLPDAKLKPMSEMAEIDIDMIVPNPTQPRTQFDEEALDELADSIRQLGVIQPVTVKKGADGKYVIISGERRWRAAQRADLKRLPVYIRDVDDENLHAMALVENIQRQDLNAIEIALGMQRLIDECHLTQDALSEKVGKKRSSVSNYLRLLKLPDEVQLALKEGLISMGHAKAIAGAPAAHQLRLLKRCIKRGLSVRQVEELARMLAERPAQALHIMLFQYHDVGTVKSCRVLNLNKDTRPLVAFDYRIPICQGDNGSGDINLSIYKRKQSGCRGSHTDIGDLPYRILLHIRQKALVNL